MGIHEDIYFDQKGLVALYGEFSDRLKNYISEMNDNIAALENIVNDLNTYWTDDNYKAYKKAMDGGLDTLSDKVYSVIELKSSIDKGRVETEAALEKMRVKYGFN